jgi:hypothetical protein
LVFIWLTLARRSSFDNGSRPILKRAFRDDDDSEEPHAKRQKSADESKPSNITDKVMQNGYAVLDELLLDIKSVVEDEIRALQSQEHISNQNADVETARHFREKANQLYRQELTYPKPNIHPATEAFGSAQEDGNYALTVYGNAPQPKYLFSSLARRAKTPDVGSRNLLELGVPDGIIPTRVNPTEGMDKQGRSQTLGELFPSPRNLPPLQPPKAPKTTTKSTVLSFYHPEPTEKSKYRSNSYFSQTISVGHWLDYSNATPSSQIKTKQRERAQSLAGHKPSSTELEMSEMESLFRGAFSSFAPTHDNSAAMVSAGQASRIWWQKYGCRQFQCMLETESPVEDVTEPVASTSAVEEIDEEAVQDVIDNWDDSLVDPSLKEAMGEKSQEEKELEDVLQDVSDLIETLSSYQRNRNLTLPTSQDRYSADPVNGDMLRNGTHAQQMSEEEMATYQTLKAQLSLIIAGLPPYAVARLNSDRLAELNVSTKVEIRMEESKGVMEETETAARSRQGAMQPAAGASRPAPHRTPSISSGSYGQYSQQYPNRPPMPATPHYQQSPSRAQPFPIQQRPSPMGGAAHSHTQQRPSQQQYRANGYQAYGQTPMAKASYGHQSVPYAGTPGQPRMQPQSGYGQSPQASTQPYRYGQGGYPQQQPTGMHSQQTPQQPGGYGPQTNGAGYTPQRPVPQSMPSQQQAYPAQQPGQQARPPYATPQSMHASSQPRHFSGPVAGASPAAGGQKAPGDYATVMDSSQMARLKERTNEQFSARMAAQERSHSFGLSSLGLGVRPPAAAMAAAHHTPSPKAAMAVPGRASPSVNGMSAPSPGSAPGASASPASVAAVPVAVPPVQRP